MIITMRTLKVLFFITVLIAYSCSEEKSNLSEQDGILHYDECLKSFNTMFSNVDFKDSYTYQFDSIRVIKPNFIKRSEEHTSNSSHVRISYAVFCLKKKKKIK